MTTITYTLTPLDVVDWYADLEETITEAKAAELLTDNRNRLLEAITQLTRTVIMDIAPDYAEPKEPS